MMRINSTIEAQKQSMRSRFIQIFAHSEYKQAHE